MESNYKEAIKILENWKELDSAQETAIASYTNGVMDLYYRGEKKVDVAETGDVADLLDEMWAHTELMVEDEDFRCSFRLICNYVLFVKSWRE